MCVLILCKSRGWSGGSDGINISSRRNSISCIMFSAAGRTLSSRIGFLALASVPAGCGWSSSCMPLMFFENAVVIG